MKNSSAMHSNKIDKMETTTILNHTELVNKILQLRQQKAIEDAALKATFKEFVGSLDPISLAKKSLHDLALDQQVQYDLVKVGLNLGTNFVIGQVMRKYPNMKGFLSSVLFQLWYIILNNSIGCLLK